MAKSKKSEIELKVRDINLPKIDYTYQKSVSYSQFSTYLTCPHQWYLTYIENKDPYSASIHTVFGTAMHETLQKYIEVMYNESGANADRLDLEEIFNERFRENYKKEYTSSKVHFSDATEMREFFNDGIAILKWIKTRRNKLFTIRNVKLLGIELPLILKLSNNLFYKAYIDFALYDEDLKKIYIYDIKTSTRGWGDREKKDHIKTSQIILYKEFFSKQFGVDVDSIEVEFFIVKRKIWEDSEYPIPRVQNFKPASGKNKRAQVREQFGDFIKECFDGIGKPIIKPYIKNVGEDSCKWCPYREKSELCDKNMSL